MRLQKQAQAAQQPSRTSPAPLQCGVALREHHDRLFELRQRAPLEARLQLVDVLHGRGVGRRMRRE